MIYTVTINPSLDYIASVHDFASGKLNRTYKEIINPGGKGINVSIVLKNLNIESTILGFIAGFTGDEIRKEILRRGFKEKLIPIKTGRSRINIKIRSYEKNEHNESVHEESELNGQGPEIDRADIEHLLKQTDELQPDDILVLAGSIPNSMPDSIYGEIMDRVKSKGCKVIADATNSLLVNTLQYNPFLIKPNLNELGEIFKTDLHNKDDAILYAKKLQDMGASNVLVSMAGDGAVCVCDDGRVLQSPAPKGKTVNSVGAGDSMIAGFIAGYSEKQDFGYAFYKGLATGSASAFSENFATLPEVETILQSIIPEEYKV